jgi:hypothetical protein
MWPHSKALHIRTLLSALVIFPMIGCVMVRNETVSAKQEAAEAINQRNYDHAIAILEAYKRSNPHDHEAAILLASAYTGSVGVNVIDSYGALEPLLKSEPKTSTANQQSTRPSEAEIPDKDNVVRSVTAFLETIDDSIAVFFKFPYAINSKRARLVSGLILITDIPKDSREYEDALSLSVIINLTQFLNYVRDMFPSLQNGETVNVKFSDLVCAISPTALSSNLGIALQYGSNALVSWKNLSLIRGKAFLPSLEKSLNTIRKIQSHLDQQQGALLVSDAIANHLRKSFCE